MSAPLKTAPNCKVTTNNPPWVNSASFVGDQINPAFLLRNGFPANALSLASGGSDVNILAQRGLQIANVSVGYREIHSTGEYIAVADLERSAELVARLLEVDSNSK